MDKISSRIAQLEKLVGDANHVIQSRQTTPATLTCNKRCSLDDETDRAYCLKHCNQTQPTATWSDVTQYANQFPKDYNKLKDPVLQNAFIFHMSFPHLIHANHEHFEHVPTIYSMPMVLHTDIIAPKAWKNTLHHAPHHHIYGTQLYENWKKLSNEDKDALLNKLSQYDVDQEMQKFMAKQQ